jgi:hypothetical protein
VLRRGRELPLGRVLRPEPVWVQWPEPLVLRLVLRLVLVLRLGPAQQPVRVQRVRPRLPLGQWQAVPW